MSIAVDTVESEVRERAITPSLAPLPDLSAAARSVHDAVAGVRPPQRHLDLDLDCRSGEEIGERLTGG